MCGHIGVMGKKLSGQNDELMVEEGLYVCALRGMDSVGLGYIPVDDEEAPYVTKCLGRPPVFVRMPGKGARCIIGHVRSATIGDKDNVELAHPFQFDNIIGAHNGTLRSDWRWVLQDQTNEKFGSDSQGVFYNFAYRGVEETVKLLHGAWCFVWWDDDDSTLNILRNDERPLWTARGKSGNLYWASEYWMIQAMVRAGEKKRDEFVKGPDGKLFQKVPVNEWLRFTHDEKGEVVQLDSIPLLGAPPPPPPPPVEKKAAPAGGKAGFVWAVWENGKWTEVPDGTKGAAKLSRSFADVSPSVTRLPTKRKGRIWREVAGVTYICARPGANEIPLQQLLEFNTDGACLQCGTFIQNPDEIGYLPNDYSFIACKDCCKEWLEEEWAAQEDPDELKRANPELAAMIEDLFPENKMVTMGTPPANDVDTTAIDAALEALDDTLPPDLLPPFIVKGNETPWNEMPLGKKRDAARKRQEKRAVPVPMRYAIFHKGARQEIFGTGCRTHEEMLAYCKHIKDTEVRTIPISANDKKRLAFIVPVEPDTPPKTAAELSRASLLPKSTTLSAPSKYALGSGWKWWENGPRANPTCNS